MEGILHFKMGSKKRAIRKQPKTANRNKQSMDLYSRGIWMIYFTDIFEFQTDNWSYGSLLPLLPQVDKSSEPSRTSNIFIVRHLSAHYFRVSKVSLTPFILSWSAQRRSPTCADFHLRIWSPTTSNALL